MGSSQYVFMAAFVALVARDQLSSFPPREARAQAPPSPPKADQPRAPPEVSASKPEVSVPPQHSAPSTDEFDEFELHFDGLDEGAASAQRRSTSSHLSRGRG